MLLRRMPRLPRIAALGAAAALCLVGLPRIAPLDAPETRAPVPGTVVLDAGGNVLERDGRDGIRIAVTLDAVAPRMRQATVSAEDRRFFQHPGVDPLATGRALTQLPVRTSGASTITQQLARRLYLADDGSPLLVRKAREAFLALQLEAHRSKREILELYLNDVYYGRGAYGVEAAARVYFGISAANLDLAHAAYLAGLPQRPSDHDTPTPDRGARDRQAYVLARMVEDGVATRAEADAALAEPIRLLPALVPPVAYQFVAYARAELARVRPDLASRDGLVIETTLDGALQSEAERLARLHVDALADRGVTDAALAAIEPGTGRILAMVGSATDGDPRHGGAIDMAVTPRQPGSALKPLLYAAALERGYTAATPLLDVPSTFMTPAGPYAPLNYDRAFHGVVPLRTALGSSLNVPAVRTLDALGLDAMLEITHRFGLTTLSAAESYGLALTLGGGEVRLLDLTAAYAALGAGGALAAPFAVSRVRDGAGRILYEHPAPAPVRVLSPARAYVLSDILADANARIVGFGYASPFDLPFPAAVKSGTSTGFRDDWSIGYTPEVAIGVWVGNADGAPMQDVSGVDAAGPLWHDAMMAAALGRRMTWYARPPGVVETTVCSPTGLLPGPACPAPVREVFVAGTEPTSVERYYARDGGGRVVIDPPLEARSWAEQAGLLLDADVRGDARVQIVAPASGSVLVMAPELAGQRVVLRAALAPGIERASFFVDGTLVGEAGAGDPSVLWGLVPGPHTLRVSGGGAEATSTFEVRR